MNPYRVVAYAALVVVGGQAQAGRAVFALAAMLVALAAVALDQIASA